MHNASITVTPPSFTISPMPIVITTAAHGGGRRGPTAADSAKLFSAFEADMRNRPSDFRITLKILSRKFFLPGQTIRKLLVEKYGNRVAFLRGRSGGIVLNLNAN